MVYSSAVVNKFLKTAGKSIYDFATEMKREKERLPKGSRGRRMSIQGKDLELNELREKGNRPDKIGPTHGD